jgi:hypothetical protein
LSGFIAEPEPVEAERWRNLEGSEDLGGGGDDGRGGRVLLDDPERERKNDFRLKERMSSVEMRGSFEDWKEGELGTELQERVREEIEELREPGRDAEDLLEDEESARRRKAKGRRNFKFDFWVFLQGVSDDRRTVGALERVESGEGEGDRATKLSFRGTGCVADLVSDCGSPNEASWSSRRSLLGFGRGAKRMRRVDGAEKARWRSRYEPDMEDEEEEEMSVWRPGRGVEVEDGDGEG